MTDMQTAEKPKSLVSKFANKYNLEANKLMATLAATAFKQKEGTIITNEQMAALLVVADQHNLNPFTKEIYAFPDKNNGIVPVVGVDGWARIANEHPQMDGFHFTESDQMVESSEHKNCPAWMEVTIYKKGSKHPVIIKEYFDEVYRPPFKGSGRNGSYAVNGPWQTHTKRMLRHKTLIQGLRYAFSFSGIYDQDEAERIIEGEDAHIVDADFSEVTTTTETAEVVTGMKTAADLKREQQESEPEQTLGNEGNEADVDSELVETDEESEVECITQIKLLVDEASKKTITKKRKAELAQEAEALTELAVENLTGDLLDENMTLLNQVIQSIQEG